VAKLYQVEIRLFQKRLSQGKKIPVLFFSWTLHMKGNLAVPVQKTNTKSKVAYSLLFACYSGKFHHHTCTCIYKFLSFQLYKVDFTLGGLDNQD